MTIAEPRDNTTTFDPWSPVFRANPYPYYEMLRAHMPVFYWDVWGITFLSRFDDCKRLLRDPRLGTIEISFEATAEQQPLEQMQSHWMLLMNPPGHTRLRGLVHKAFNLRFVEQMRTPIQTITNDLLDRVQDAGRMELIADLAYHLPVRVIAQMFGVPSEDHVRFYAWSNELARSLDRTEEPEVYDREVRAAAEMTAYLRDIVAKRRRNPRNDLLSAFIAAEKGGGRLSEEEMYAMCALLLVAGQVTVDLIGNGTLALLRHPEAFQRLRQEPALIRTAVEELLRFDSPVQLTTRVAFEDIEIRGHTVVRGQRVGFLLGSANHDPERFPEPQTLDLARNPNPHLAFGSGIHYCLGAPLARLVGQIAIATLVRRMPKLALATEAPEYRDNYVLRGLKSLPLTF